MVVAPAAVSVPERRGGVAEPGEGQPCSHLCVLGEPPRAEGLGAWQTGEQTLQPLLPGLVQGPGPWHMAPQAAHPPPPRHPLSVGTSAFPAPLGQRDEGQDAARAHA